MEIKNNEEHWNKYDDAGIGVGAYTDFAKLSSLVCDKDILEVGCGRGHMLSKLSTAKSRVGIDPSSEAIKLAKEKEEGLDFSVGYAESLLYKDNKFDVVYSLEVIEHVLDYETMIIEIHRVLRPGGCLFIQTPNYPVKRIYDFVYWLSGKRDSLKDDYTHVTKLSAFALKKALAKKFEIEEVYSRNIIFDSRLTFLKKRKITQSLGLFFGQKTIVLCLKK
jgi:2-polyprenyl-3-methyl-5-hydroxy-6-metoxy-1,4-benzoquinol methylase